MQHSLATSADRDCVLKDQRYYVYCCTVRRQKMENTSIRMGGLLVFKSPVIMARYEMQLIEAERGYQLQARKKQDFILLRKPISSSLKS